MIITYRYRVKDRASAKRLREYAGAVNFVWNYCVETQREAQRRGRLWPTEFDLFRLMAGASKDVDLLAQTLRSVAENFVRARTQYRKCPAFRSRKSGHLGWIPFNRPQDFRVDAANRCVFVRRRKYRLWFSRPTPPGATIKSGCFSEDSRGRWYFNVNMEIPEPAPKQGPTIAIDLGIKDFATLSDGRKIEMPSFFRRYEQQIAIAKRRGQRKRARALYAKSKNCRRNFLHQESTRIVREHGCVIVGDVNTAKLAKTRMAKSVMDAGWSMFRTMLRYKAVAQGATFEIVSEYLSTQVCSGCGAVGGPKGIAGLRMRHWTCSGCGATHDRDVNAARNLLRAGAERRPPGAGIAA